MGEVSMFKYGSYASHPSRSRLPDLRRGGYEGLKERFSGGVWKNEETRMPDSWSGEWDESCDRFGAMAIGVRPILIAYNVNIEEVEPQVSATVGKVLRTSGFLIKSESGQRIRVGGMLESVQGMGVKLESHGISQVSMNLSNPDETDIHVAYEAVLALARALGARVNGSEIVGLVPLQSMLRAGRWYLGEDASEETLVEQAILGLGLSTLEKFNPESRIIEWALRDI
jgi:glutamate formiminotransferase/formiminotetrahydrofolate cyclodeaminase